MGSTMTMIDMASVQTLTYRDKIINELHAEDGEVP
jgi:hypothetical protein